MNRRGFLKSTALLLAGVPAVQVIEAKAQPDPLNWGERTAEYFDKFQWDVPPPMKDGKLVPTQWVHFRETLARRLLQPDTVVTRSPQCHFDNHWTGIIGFQVEYRSEVQPEMLLPAHHWDKDFPDTVYMGLLCPGTVCAYCARTLRTPRPGWETVTLSLIVPNIVYTGEDCGLAAV